MARRADGGEESGAWRVRPLELPRPASGSDDADSCLLYAGACVSHLAGVWELWVIAPVKESKKRKKKTWVSSPLCVGAQLWNPRPGRWSNPEVELTIIFSQKAAHQWIQKCFFSYTFPIFFPYLSGHSSLFLGFNPLVAEISPVIKNITNSSS